MSIETTGRSLEEIIIDRIKAMFYEMQTKIKDRGVKVEGTRELPWKMSTQHYPADATNYLSGLSYQHADLEALVLEKEEYSELSDQCLSQVGHCILHGEKFTRKAVVLHKGCITYQHFYVREGRLVHVVHMRGMDLRKWWADFMFFFKVQNLITTMLEVKDVEFSLTVDCLHIYDKPDEVPL